MLQIERLQKYFIKTKLSRQKLLKKMIIRFGKIKDTIYTKSFFDFFDGLNNFASIFFEDFDTNKFTSNKVKISII